ncbi:MAG: nitroreductase [Thermoprotei archaeon]|nr:MAG: nitroreductase [Thermoprotei archaeon]
MTKISSIGQLFYEKTKLKKCLKGKKTPTESKILYKSYPRFKQIRLPTKIKTSELSFENILLNRRSVRDFTGAFISLEELSYILYFSAGISVKGEDWNEALRMYPSAGARYPLELYIIGLRVKNLHPGLYHYNVKRHSLERLFVSKKQRIIDETVRICCNQEFVKRCSVVFIITSIFGRTTLKYGERGYRYVLIEAGHLAQNIYLTATAIRLGCCGIGGFLDDEVVALLDLERVEERPIYLLAVGKV